MPGNQHLKYKIILKTKQKLIDFYVLIFMNSKSV
jgi:hypothetical protein